VRIKIGLAAIVLITTPNAARADIDSMLGLSWKKPIGSDPKRTPPIDDPRLPWFEYRKDSLGRETFLSDSCLNERNKELFEFCVREEENEHLSLISRHDFEAQQQAEAQARRRSEEQWRVDQDRDATEREIAKNRELEQKIAEEKRPETHVQRIRDAKRQIDYFRSAIARQRRIAAISGYEDKRVLYNAGAFIDYNVNLMKKEYILYQQCGGRLSLAAIVGR
jgi:hypothetical protein